MKHVITLLTETVIIDLIDNTLAGLLELPILEGIQFTFYPIHDTPEISFLRLEFHIFEKFFVTLL